MTETYYLLYIWSPSMTVMARSSNSLSGFLSDRRWHCHQRYWWGLWHSLTAFMSQCSGRCRKSQGLRGMREGGIRQLYIPVPSLAELSLFSVSVSISVEVSSSLQTTAGSWSQSEVELSYDEEPFQLGLVGVAKQWLLELLLLLPGTGSTITSIWSRKVA